MKSAITRLCEIAAGLPSGTRVEIALAMRDLSDYLMSMKPAEGEPDRLARLAQLEIELSGNRQKVAIICERLAISRATYFRDKESLRQRRESLKVSLGAVSRETASE